MRIAVTGASGFVGGWVARLLARQGHEVLSFGRRAESALAFALPNYRRWDISARTLATASVDAVVHAAALVGDWGPWSDYEAVNVRGTRNVLASFSARFIHVSSSSVYTCEGRHPPGPRGEGYPLASSFPNAYVRSKVAAEQVVLSARPTATILRPHIVYGPGDTTLMPRLLAARRHGRLLVPGTGRNRVSVTHVFNFVQAVACALRPQAPCGVFNIADAASASVDELLRTILQRHGEPVRIGYLPAWAAWPMAAVLETVWRGLRRRHAPPLTRYLVDQLSGDHELDIAQARARLGYRPRWTYLNGPIR